MFFCPGWRSNAAYAAGFWDDLRPNTQVLNALPSNSGATICTGSLACRPGPVDALQRADTCARVAQWQVT